MLDLQRRCLPNKRTALKDNINAFDEHIWSSPANAIKMAEYLKNVIIELDYENAETYTKNAEAFSCSCILNIL